MGSRSAGYAPYHTVLARRAIGGSGYDPSAAPSMCYLGSGIQDHRFPFNARGSSSALPGALGFYAEDVLAIDAVPSTLSATNIAAAQNVVNGTPVTLVAATGAGITVLAAAQSFLPQPIVGAGLVNGSTGSPTTVWGASGQNVVPAGACVIDGVPGVQAFGGGANQPGLFNTSFYDPATMLARAIKVTGVAGGTGGTFVVKGVDIYGFPMTQNLVATAGATTVSTLKAFKAITSITPQFTDAHNYSFGTTDVYGFPLLTLRFSKLYLLWNEVPINVNTGLVAPDQTNPATATTGDVRGTYATQSASDGTKRLVAYITPDLASLATDPTFGLFGRTQV